MDPLAARTATDFPDQPHSYGSSKKERSVVVLAIYARDALSTIRVSRRFHQVKL